MIFNSLIIKVKHSNYQRYNEAFNFFQSKSINAIVASRKVDYAILYRDFQFFDDRTEYLKRYYANAETITRIKKLINYYENNLSAPNPNLLLLPQYHIIEAHNRKIIKLCILKQKSLAKRIARLQLAAQTNSNHMKNLSQDEYYLNLIDESNYSDAQSQKQNQEQSRYDSEVHDAYDYGGFEQEKQYNGQVFDFHQLKSVEDSGLIIQFEIQPAQNIKKNNINGPQQPPLSQIQIVVSPEKKKSATVAVQTLPFQSQPSLLGVKKQQKQKSMQKQKMKSNQRILAVPEMQKNLPSSQMIIAEPIFRGQLKNQNMILTESIHLPKKQQQKKKTGTFMQYYNSIPVKSPSNILQRYVKKKK